MLSDQIDIFLVVMFHVTKPVCCLCVQDEAIPVVQLIPVSAESGMDMITRPK